MSTLASLPAPSMDGDLVLPSHPAYEELRRVDNQMFDRRPAGIARCASVADVVTALAFAREAGTDVCVRAGGHSAPGLSQIDGALVIDIRALKSVDIDPEARIARVGTGLTWGELDAATQQHGLAVTGGRVSSTGIGGLTLGSGSGWLERAMGLTSDNLLAVQVVTADGRVVTASDDENADLFWALRGGGGGFGIATQYTYRLAPVGPIVRAGMRMFPFARAAELLRTYDGIMRDAPDELCGGVALLCAPPAPFVPAEAVGKPVVAVVALWAGALEDADAGLQPLAALGEPVADVVSDMPYTAFQQILDQGNPFGTYRQYLGSGFLPALDEESIATFTDAAANFASPLTVLLLQPLGGAYARVPEDATALGQRDAGWAYQILNKWPSPDDDATCVAWSKELNARLQRHGQLPSFPNFVADPDALRSAYPPQTLERLQAAKRAWDPDNVFCHTHKLL